MRLFAALPLPDPAVQRLLSLRLRLSHPRDGLRWSTPAQWHITLGFFGDVSPAAARCIEQELCRVEVEAPELSLDGLGLFSGKGILYAATTHPPQLDALHAAAQKIGTACGSALESRLFHPHITLARAKGKLGSRTLQQMARPELPSMGALVGWCAGEMLLLESTLGPDGASYTVRCCVPLLKPHRAAREG